jgi:hypothetical protein
MKIIFTTIALLLVCFIALAQDQVTNSGNLRIHSGAKITFRGDFTNNGFFVDNGTLCTFTGSGNQIIAGIHPVSFRSLKINNANGITLQVPLEIKDTLDLSSGPLNLNSNMLTITNSSSSAIMRTDGYIISENTYNLGKVKWNTGENLQAHVFPFGAVNGEYIPFTFNLTDGDVGNVTVSTYHTEPDNTPLPSTPQMVYNINDVEGNDNSANTVNRFWQIDHDGTGGTANITFTCTIEEADSINSLQAQRWNDTTNLWEFPSEPQTATLTSVTISGIHKFSPWTLSGTKIKINEPLPISLVKFEASKKNATVELTWTTSSETNNDFFTVEKTTDFNYFETVGIKKGAGNSNQSITYDMTDYNPYSGISYYRLKQTDFDGNSVYSNFKYVLFGANELSTLELFPNPANNSDITIDVTSQESGMLQLIVRDIFGAEAFKTSFNIDKGRNLLKLDKMNGLKAGLYTFSFISAGKQVTKKMVIL